METEIDIQEILKTYKIGSKVYFITYKEITILSVVSGKTNIPCIEEDEISGINIFMEANKLKFHLSLKNAGMKIYPEYVYFDRHSIESRINLILDEKAEVFKSFLYEAVKKHFWFGSTG